MEAPAKTAVGGSLITTLAIGGMVAAGVTVGVVADPVAPPARAADGLTTFADCDALKGWYVDHTIDQVGAYGWGGRWITMREGAPMTDLAGAAGRTDSAKAGVANGATGTNTQEAGVDEPDVAKTNGRIVVRLLDSRRLVITDVTGSSAREVADWPLPRGSFVDGLLLVGDHVLLAGGRGTGKEPMPMESFDKVRPIGGSPGTELIDLDVSDPAHPRLDSRTSWSGSQLSLGQYGDTVRLVTWTGLPSLPFVEPRPGRRTEKEAEQLNRAIVRTSSVEDWLPGLSSEAGSEAGSGPLLGCDQVYHPKTSPGSGTVAVATFTPGAVGDASAVAVTGAGAQVYSSTDRLYVSSMDWGDRVFLDRPETSSRSDGSVSESSPIRPVTTNRTHIHAFALDGDSTSYVASGVIDGTLRDRWSLDEYDGHLRVAVSWHDRRGNSSESGIVVLDEQDGRLEPVGQLRGLGVDEEVQSVRWFDDLAIVVTFRQVDPLYTIDLRDPAHPRRLGALKIPGFSAYLHPIGGDRLLGLGADATFSGRNRGAQAAVFDIGDPTRARQVGKVTFGGETWLAASEDPHAFTWLPDAKAAITSLQRWDSPAWGMEGEDSDTAMVLLRVSPTGEVSTEQLPSPGGWQPRALPLDSGRVALVGTTVKIVSIKG
jgi:hypothetical protein